MTVRGFVLLLLISVNWPLLSAQALPSLSSYQLKQIAISALTTKIIEKSLDQSWSKVSADKPQKTSSKGEALWIVSFRNKKAQKNNKIYVFINSVGKVTKVNFTGK